MNSESNKDKCKKEAIRLALKYNFVTDVTSMVIEEEDKYVKKGAIDVDENAMLADKPDNGGRKAMNMMISAPSNRIKMSRIIGAKR